MKWDCYNRKLRGIMLQKITILLLSVLSGVHSEDNNQRSTILAHTNFNHPYNKPIVQNRLPKLKPTEKGPVLFPNDGPPQPKTPLIVTSRPLSEQLTKYLNKHTEQNNSLASPSYFSPKYEPNYLARFNVYKPFPQAFSTQNPILINPVTETTLYPVGNFEDFSAKTFDDNKDFYDYSGNAFDGYSGKSGEDYKHPYADVLKKSRLLNNGYNKDNRYNDYEERTILPPIYKALSDHAKQNVLKTKDKKANYQVKEHDYSKHYDNDVDKYGRDDSEGHHQNQNYAFSYTVKDHHTGDDFSHSQHSTGSSTNGEYRVRLPDGRMQIVSYTADENGYKADVRYDDEQVDKTENSIEYTTNNGYKTPNKNYNNRDKPYKPKNHDYYNRNTDPAKDYYSDDYNYEYNNFNEQQKANFNFDANVNSNTKLGVIVVPNHQRNSISTVKPSYDELKPLFVTKNYNIASTIKPSYEQPNTVFATKIRSTPSTVKPDYENLRSPFTSKNLNTLSTVKPSYEELRHLFVTDRPAISSTSYYSKIPVEINTPSTKADPLDFRSETTERVVVIGGSKPPLYSNIIGNLPNSAKIPATTAKYFYTPSPSVQILSSTASPQVKNVNLSNESKAILSESFMNRINKYLRFK